MEFEFKYPLLYGNTEFLFSKEAAKIRSEDIFNGTLPDRLKKKEPPWIVWEHISQGQTEETIFDTRDEALTWAKQAMSLSFLEAVSYRSLKATGEPNSSDAGYVLT